jgi:hypothetical protein
MPVSSPTGERQSVTFHEGTIGEAAALVFRWLLLRGKPT